MPEGNGNTWVGQLASYTSLFMLIFTSVALSMSKTAEVSSECGDDLWNITLSTLILHLLLLPCVVACVIAPVLNHERSPLEKNMTVFTVLLIGASMLFLTVLVLEAYYTADALGKSKCVEALNNATKTTVPLLTTANIIFSVYDGIMLVAMLIVLGCTPCIFRALTEDEESRVRPIPQYGSGFDEPLPVETRSLLMLNVRVERPVTCNRVGLLL